MCQVVQRNVAPQSPHHEIPHQENRKRYQIQMDRRRGQSFQKDEKHHE